MSNTDEKLAIGVFLLWIFGIIVIFSGYIINIIKLVHMNVIDVEFVLRALGLLAFPLGGIMGWFV